MITADEARNLADQFDRSLKDQVNKIAEEHVTYLLNKVEVKAKLGEFFLHQEMDLGKDPKLPPLIRQSIIDILVNLGFIATFRNFDPLSSSYTITVSWEDCRYK